MKQPKTNPPTPFSLESMSIENWIFSEMFNKMGSYIYITDVKTDQILFMNQKMKEAFGIQNPEGKLCWQVLQADMNTRCKFCPVPFLEPNHPTNSSYLWEEKNTLTHKVYENYDSLMRWHDGRIVHFQHSIDITEIKHLHKVAYTDELTGTLNRRAGKKQLQKLIDHCYENNALSSIAMFDINELKKINDTFGHIKGDFLIVEIANAVHAILNNDDVLCRLSGDEFLAIFWNTTKKEATFKMNLALEHLRHKNLFPELNRSSEFCFGIIEVGKGPKSSVEQLICLADEALYEKKRSLHIENAAKQLARDAASSLKNTFSYDESSLYPALVTSTEDYLYICNMETGVFRYPSKMVDEFALPGEIIENAAAIWEEKIHPNDKKIFLNSNQEIADGRTDSHIIEYRAKNRKGEWAWLRCRGQVIRDKEGHPILFAGFIKNLGKKGRIDSTTGLYNKFEFEDELEWQLSNPANQNIAVLLFGIDQFKHINNHYDHLFGDEVIRIVSEKIISYLPLNAVTYRMDSDQFGVILRNGTKEIAELLFSDLQREFNMQQSFDDKPFYCTLSCGCVFSENKQETYLDLLKQAGIALDYAKMRGKNRMEIFSKEILPDVEHSVSVTELLRESISHHMRGFSLHYQPIFTLDRKVKGAEALCRYYCDAYGNVRPDIFIGYLEKSSLILPVGKWVFEQAAAYCKSILPKYPDFIMQINLSYLQLEDVHFFSFVKSTLEKLELSPEHIVLELTESYLAENIDRLSQLLSQFRDIGIKIAMDDFGTGYSSLSVLKNVPLDIVKIDRCFVREIHQKEFDRSFVKMVVELCHTVNMTVCLEGLETEEQYDIVLPMAVDSLQGFLLGKPMPQEDFQSTFLV